jgi:hypothetical protein
VKIIRTEKQRENLAKYFWDMSKVAFAVLVVGPFAKPESLSAAGLLVGYRYRISSSSLGLSPRWNEGSEMNPFTVALIILGIIAVVGLIIVFFDKGLKRRS